MIQLLQIFLLLLTFSSQGFADDLIYSHEINGIRDRARIYRDESIDRLEKMQNYDLALADLEWRGRDIAFTVGLAKANNGFIDRMQELAQEYAYTESVWDKLDQNEQGIREALNRANIAAKALPELSERHRAISENTEKSLKRLREEFSERRKQLKRDQEIWLAEKDQAVLKAIAERRMETLTKIEYSNRTAAIGALFRRIHFNFLLKGSAHKRPDAENLLTGFRWLRGVIPLYITATNPEQKQELAWAIDDNDRMEKDMVERLQKWPSEEGHSNDSNRFSLDYIKSKEDSGNEKNKGKETDQAFPIPANIPEGAYWQDTHKDEKTGNEWTRTYYSDGHTVETSTMVTTIDYGPEFGNKKQKIVEKFQRTKNAQNVLVAKGEDLQIRMQKEDHERLNFGNSPSREPRENLRSETRNLHELLKQAENDSKSDKDLQRLTSEVIYYETLQDHFNKDLDQASKSLKNRVNRNEPVWNDLANKSIPQAPTKGTAPTTNYGEAAREAGKALADGVLSYGVPGYDLGQFVFAVAFDATFLGAPVNTNEKMILGSIGVISLAPGGKATASSFLHMIHLIEKNPAVGKLLVQAIKELPSDLRHLEPLLVKVGSGEKIALIGRSMGSAKEKGVKALADELNKAKEGLVEIFESSKEALDGWNEMIKDLKAGERLADDLIKNSALFEENESWIKKLIDEGYSILDMGNPYSKAKSLNYEMEKWLLGLEKGKYAY